MIAHYLDGWQRPTDFGVIAELDGEAVGAAWARQFGAAGNPLYLDDRTPELAIAIRPGMRGRGFGTQLMRALIADAASRGLGMCLNVRETSPAMRLYQRLGFRRMPGREVPNRAGGLSIGMVLGHGGENPFRRRHFRGVDR